MRQTIVWIAGLLLVAGCSAEKAQDASADAGTSGTAATGPVSFCEELQRMVSETDCTLARELVDNAENGVAAFNAPNPMTRGKTETLQLVVAFAPPPPPEPGPVVLPPEEPATTAPAPAPVEAPPEPPEPPVAARPVPVTPADTVDPLPGKTVEFTPVVGRHMAAELSGDGFEIVARSPRSQDVLPDSQTSWEWAVTPRRKGPLTLTLKTFVEAEFADGKRYALRSLTTNQTVDVAVTPLDRAGDFLDGLPGWLKRVTLILGAVTALLTAWFALRKVMKNRSA